MLARIRIAGAGSDITAGGCEIVGRGSGARLGKPLMVFEGSALPKEGSPTPIPLFK